MSDNGSQFAVTVREGANLPDTWTDTRIGAVTRLLPSDIQDQTSVIAFLSLAQRYNLDPFAKEIYAWKGENGKVQTFVSRDGLSRKLRESPLVDGYDVQVVYSEDEFSLEKTAGGKVNLVHKSNPFAKGAVPVGAYCVVRGSGDRPDVVVTRRFDDYSHLSNKKTWKNNRLDMISARVLSAAARLVVSLGGVYLPEDFAETEESVPGAKPTKEGGKIATLKAELGLPEEEEPTTLEGAIEAEYEVLEEEETTPEPVEVLEEPDDSDGWTEDLPAGYTAIRGGGRGWYVVEGPDGKLEGGKKFRPADGLEVALKDVFVRNLGSGSLAEVLEYLESYSGPNPEPPTFAEIFEAVFGGLDFDAFAMLSHDDREEAKARTAEHMLPF